MFYRKTKLFPPPLTETYIFYWFAPANAGSDHLDSDAETQGITAEIILPESGYVDATVDAGIIVWSYNTKELAGNGSGNRPAAPPPPPKSEPLPALTDWVIHTMPHSGSNRIGSERLERAECQDRVRTDHEPLTQTHGSRTPKLERYAIWVGETNTTDEASTFLTCQRQNRLSV